MKLNLSGKFGSLLIGIFGSFLLMAMMLSVVASFPDFFLSFKDWEGVMFAYLLAGVLGAYIYFFVEEKLGDGGQCCEHQTDVKSFAQGYATAVLHQLRREKANQFPEEL